MDFIKGFYIKFLYEYKKFLLSKVKKNKKKNINVKCSTTKHSMNSCCTMKLSSETDAKKEKMHQEVKNIVKKYFHSPEKLIQYIKAKGGKVYKIKNAEKILSKFGEEEGFLTPIKGFTALILNILVSLASNEKINFSFSSKEMFIFNTEDNEIYTIARALYKYYGYKNELPGYDYKTQATFKKMYNTRKNSSSPFEGCSIEDLYACKEAIARDVESINFSLELSVEYERAKKAALKLADAKGASI